MLASGAHVEIGGVQYLLEEAVDEHYVHRFLSLFSRHDGGDIEQPIPGTQKISARPERLLWTVDDWSGGEGNRVWYPDDPTVYHRSGGIGTGEANPRIRGRITGRPAKASVTVATGEVDERVFLVQGVGGRVWAIGNRQAHYSDNAGETFTAHPSNPLAGVSDIAKAVAGNEDAIWAVFWDGTLRNIRKLTTAASTEVVTGGQSASIPDLGATVFRGRLYTWNGRKLFEYDIEDTLPLGTGSRRVAFNLGLDTASLIGVRGGMVAGETRLYFFSANLGVTQVYEYRHRGGARPMWKLPLGFTGESISYQLGVLFVFGHFGSDAVSSGRGAIYALPLASRSPLFINWVREAENLRPQRSAPSYGAQVMFTTDNTSRVFIYDMELDAVSMMDIPTTTLAIGDVLTNQKYRLVAMYDTGSSGVGNYTIYRYSDDQLANAETNTAIPEVETGVWEFDYPNETKTLLGFHVAHTPLVAGQSILVEYQIDESNSWVSAGSVTATGGVGRHFLAVSTDASTIKFQNLKWRVSAPAAGVGVAPPVIRSVTAEASLPGYDEVWDLIVKVNDEQNQSRTSKRKVDSVRLRDNLELLATNGNIAAFKDGYRYHVKSDTADVGYKEYDVVVENPTDIITHNAEGIMAVRLRKIQT